MKKCFLLILMILFSAVGSAQDVKPTYYNFLYKVEEGDTFASLLRMYVKDDSVINKSTPLVLKNIKNNPQVKDWRDLIPGALIYVYIPENLMDMTKYQAKQKSVNTKNEEIKKEIIAKISPPSGFKGSAFYMASWGDFSQTSGETTVEYKQNSLVNLGLQGNYLPKNSLYSFSSSIYFSTFTAADATLPPNSVKLPPEVGFNFYGDYLWKKPRISWQAGLDYEKFSSFNIEGILNDQKIYLDRISVVYATVGVSHVFYILEKPFFIKTSLSKSVSSTTTTDYTASTNKESLTGMKALFYLNYKFTDKFFLHSLLKIHKMSGPSDLSSTRLGVGVGYILF
jgi:hypothetical protein